MWNGRFCWYRENGKTYIGIQIYRITQFKDIKARSLSLHEAEGYGWSAIDLSIDEIVIPDRYKGAFLIFDVMDEGEGTQKAMVITFQDQSREKLNAGFYQTSGVLGIYNKTRIILRWYWNI